MCFIATRKILEFYVIVVNSSRLNVLKEGVGLRVGNVAHATVVIVPHARADTC